MKMKYQVSLSVLMAVSSSNISAATSTLEKVMARGSLICGVSPGVTGFSIPDDKGNWSGLDVDYCRSVAAAVFNDETKVKFVSLSAKDRFYAVDNGSVDILARLTTKTMTRDVSLNLNFTGVTYYDGQGFMVNKSLNVNDASKLKGVKVCTDAVTTVGKNLADFFKLNKIEYKTMLFESSDSPEAFEAYNSGKCDVISTDASVLYARKNELTNPEAHIILPNIISKEPLTPAVRRGDDQWLDVAEWTRNCTINAEELGVTSKNVEVMKKTDDPAIKTLLGVEGDLGQLLGLDSSWCANIVEKVGNYGESYERNLGPNAKVSIDRGLNRLWNEGGIIYAAPIK